MSKTKHNPPRKSKPGFIEFSQVQKNYLNEVRVRQINEWNEALESVYEDLGILEKIREAAPGTYKLRQNDLSGLDILPIKQEESESQGTSEKKDGKDN